MKDNRDRPLVRLAREGSGEAFAELLGRHWSPAWKTAYAVTGHRTLADDAVQDAADRAFRSLAGFDDRLPFWPWLKRIVVNCAIDQLRHERRIAAAERRYEELWLAPAAADAADTDATLAAAVAGLAPIRRLVVVLHYWLDYSVDEIATLLELPFGTVASRLSRALGELRAALEEDPDRVG